MNVVMIYFYSKRFRFAPSFNNTTSYRSWLLCACFLTTQVVEPGGAARQAPPAAKMGRRPWSHTARQSSVIRPSLPWEHLLASASSKTQTAALFAFKKSERGCGIDGDVAASAAVTGAATAASTAMSPCRRR